jgi:beta-phosphoglucomutase
MTLKAVLFDFNGVIINDEPLHEELLEQLLLEENLRPKPGEFRQLSLGRSDRVAIAELFSSRERVLTAEQLDTLVARKARAYHQKLSQFEKLPIYPGLEDFIFNLRATQCKLAVVSGAIRAEIEFVLTQSELRPYFSVIVAGDDITTSKPQPDGYLLAVDRLNQTFPDLQLKPAECLAIEDTFAGIQAAKNAGIPVIGVANSYPFHMLQRRANWTVDFLSDLELDRIQQVYARSASSAAQ